MVSTDGPAERDLLRACGLWKTYSAPALAGVDFLLRSGEVHALVGENGAGKSTLAKIIAGVTSSDSGEMALEGKPYHPSSKAEGERHGVRLVMQELNLVANLTVAENIFLDQLPHRWGWIDCTRLQERARAVLRDLGLEELDPDCPVSALGVGQQQLVEIAAGLCRQCKVLILDEPTAALTAPEIERLFTQIARLRGAGVGLIYISHRLEEIQRMADRITILRDGKVVQTRAAASVTPQELVRLMVGRDLGQWVERSRAAGPVALRVEGLRVGTAVRDVSFEARRGEILGFAGLMGAGRTETMRAIFGADRADAGAVYIGGAARPARIRSPRDAVRQGLALLTEDRKGQGLLLPLSVRANVTLLQLAQLSWGRSWLRSRVERATAERWGQALNIRCASLEQKVSELSGGNQQKVVVARWLLKQCAILMFDEPTRGIDVGAKFEIYQLLARLAEEGKAILFISSDLKELVAICDRLIVMSAGQVAGSFARGEWTEEKIMTAAFSRLAPGSAALASDSPDVPAG